MCNFLLDNLPPELYIQLFSALGFSDVELTERFSINDKVMQSRREMEHVMSAILKEWLSRCPCSCHERLAKAVLSMGYLNVAVKIHPQSKNKIAYTLCSVSSETCKVLHIGVVQYHHYRKI